MDHWNAQFTQLIRKTHPTWWGNWSLGHEIRPGGIGVVDPLTGSFTPVADAIPGLDTHPVQTTPRTSDWNMMTSNVSRKEAKVELDSSLTDPETGVEARAGLELSWTFGRAGEMVSECALEHSAALTDLDTLVAANLDWLLARAEASGMGSRSGIAQGFGIVTEVLYARSGINLGSLAADNTFSMSGTASGVQKLVGQARGKGSYLSSSSTKSLDKHVWPSASGQLPEEPVPLAFGFASFDGRLLLPAWVNHIGAFQLIVRNTIGCTYLVRLTLGYDSGGRRHTERTVVSGGLTATFAGIPLDASEVDLHLEFVCLGRNEEKRFHWRSPRGQWIGGTRHVEIEGTWPGPTHAVDVEARLPAA